MTDADCIAFLQWCLPRMRLRWAGFRKVRRQVCRRIRRRIDELGLDGFAAYRRLLDQRPAEWETLDRLCYVSISRFFRDRGAFEALRDRVLPAAASRAAAAGRPLRIWCAGCASGEEVYTLAVLWGMALAPRHPGLSLELLGTERDEHLLERARRGRYPGGSLRELPDAWRRAAFAAEGDAFRLRARFREPVTFARQDLRRVRPAGEFDLILCRNLAFTYFDDALQREVAAALAGHLGPGGLLLVGSHERAPTAGTGLERDPSHPWLYRRAATG